MPIPSVFPLIAAVCGMVRAFLSLLYFLYPLVSLFRPSPFTENNGKEYTSTITNVTSADATFENNATRSNCIQQTIQFK